MSYYPTRYDDSRYDDDAGELKYDSLDRMNESSMSWRSEARMFADPPSQRYPHSLSRFVTGLLSVVFCGAGMCIMVVLLEQDAVLPICTQCKKLVDIVVGIGAGLVATSLIGGAAVYTRARPLAVLFAVINVLLAILCFGIGTSAVLLRTGVMDADLASMWRDSVRMDPDLVCTIQRKLNCSGYDTCCGSAANHCLAAGSEWNLECAAQCTASNSHSATCKAPVEATLHDHLVTLIAGSFSSSVAFIGGAVASARMTIRR